VEPNPTGRVFNIQRYSIHDGAGIRTLIFLKGCPLRCQWCSNPESQKSAPELGFIESTCPGVDTCGAPCVEACPEEVVTLNPQGKPIVDRNRCTVCGDCAEVCCHDALKLVGREMTVAEVLVEVEKDRPFYRRSGGGVTIGGGEPLAQAGFTAALLEAAQDEYLHTALETSGHARWEQLEAVLRHVDQLHYDVKHLDPERHRELTGQSNELILNNLERVLSIKGPQDVVIRIPVIPGRNDDAENISESAKFVAGLGYTQIELVPYHMMGVSKYGQYGMVYPLDGLEPAQEENLRDLKAIVSGFGLQEMTGRI
jgi:pyruvate formate lyase activating enzyme